LWFFYERLALCALFDKQLQPVLIPYTLCVCRRIKLCHMVDPNHSTSSWLWV
jgi:hypothetical protein